MTLEKRASNIRRRIIVESYNHGLGHVGSCLSCVEILTVLFFEIMKPGDKFVLSPGHKGLALYATLLEQGKLDKIDLEKLGGHPNKKPELGIDFSTGSLGHGLSLGCGCALAGQRTYVLLSDGDLDEGSTWEAMDFIKRESKRFNGRLTIIVDCNGWSAFRRTENPFDIPTVDGHSIEQLKEWFEKASKMNTPLIVAKTIKGKGLPDMEDKLESHYRKVTKEEYENYTYPRV